MAESDPSTISGNPVIWKSGLVWSFISFSIHEPDGYIRASWSSVHWAWAWVNCVPPPPGFM